MSAEDQIDMLHNIPPLSNHEKRRRRKAAIMLTLSTIVSLLFLIYAFVQKMEADQQRLKAEEAQRIAIESKVEAEQQRKMAEAARMEADVQRIQAVAQQLRAEEALANCQKSKK